MSRGSPCFPGWSALELTSTPCRESAKTQASPLRPFAQAWTQTACQELRHCVADLKIEPEGPVQSVKGPASSSSACLTTHTCCTCHPRTSTDSRQPKPTNLLLHNCLDAVLFFVSCLAIFSSRCSKSDGCTESKQVEQASPASSTIVLIRANAFASPIWNRTQRPPKT